MTATAKIVRRPAQADYVIEIHVIGTRTGAERHMMICRGIVRDERGTKGLGDFIWGGDDTEKQARRRLASLAKWGIVEESAVPVHPNVAFLEWVTA